jgi:hypothetical protein
MNDCIKMIGYNLYSPMDCTAFTEPQCLYKGDLYLFFTLHEDLHTFMIKSC